jgi:flagellin-like protein
MKKINRNKKGVSEVVGTILMLGLAITLFAAVYITAVNFPFNEPDPSVRISATADKNTIVFAHQGGESLPADTRFIVAIDEDIYYKTAAQMNVSGDWNIGEILIFDDLPPLSLVNQEAKVTVVDGNSNSVVMQGTVRGE